MKCPVCGEECVEYAHELLDVLHDIFAPCPDCTHRSLNKNRPLDDMTITEPCACGKRFIDDVIAQIYVIMREEGDLADTDPLKRVGTPLVHPGFAMTEPPFLPEKSLVLLSKDVTAHSAQRIVEQVPEVKGVVKDMDIVPGISDIDLDGVPETHELLAGCDVRANVFTTQERPVVIYKQQSVMHIEFPRGFDPKIVNVGVKVKHFKPRIFVDACSGAGKLGIIAAFLGVPHTILNDAWWAAAYWSAYNIRINRENINIDDIEIFFDYEEMKQRPVVTEPLKIAETTGGEQLLEVYQGDFRDLHTVLPPEIDLTALDLFEKRDMPKSRLLVEEWQKMVGGEVFIP